MTRKTSFKNVLGQGMTFFLRDVKSCLLPLLVFVIVCIVSCVICGTLASVASQYGAAYETTVIDGDYTSFGSAEYFEIFSIILVYLYSIVFAVFCSVKIFSYLHNRRKTDLYGSFPIGRGTLLVTKTVTAYLLSVVPALVLIGLIVLASVCMGGIFTEFAAKMFYQIPLGAFASITFFALVSVCCGTSFNSVVTFIAICVGYPLSAVFIKSTISGCFSGLFFGSMKNSVVMNALNPLAAYDGFNVVYWLLFSCVCVAVGVFLAKRRKSERAQSAVVSELPCYAIKVFISFFSGMLLGLLFGALGTFGGYGGFVFGFLLASVPMYFITHLILYRGVSRFVRTLIPLGAVVIVSLGGMALCCCDVFGYRSYVPSANDVESAGAYYYDASYVKGGITPEKLADMAGDFSDKDTVESIIASNAEVVDLFKDSDAQTLFQNIWYSVYVDNFDSLFYYSTSSNYNGSCETGFAYKLKNGAVVTRAYSSMALYYDSVCLPESLRDSKEYIQKYSPLINADYSEMSTMSVIGPVEDSTSSYAENCFEKNTDVLSSTDYTMDAYTEISEAFAKDIEKSIDGELQKAAIGFENEFSFYYDYSSFYSIKEEVPDAVCIIAMSAGSSDANSAYYANTVYYVIPKSFTNTLKTLRDLEIIDENGNMLYTQKYGYYYTMDDEYVYSEQGDSGDEYTYSVDGVYIGGN